MSIEVSQQSARFTFIRRYPLTVFFLGSVILGSLVTWLLARIPTSPIILPLLAFPISYIPTAMALLVLRLAGSPEEWGAFRRRRTRWRVG